MNWEIRNLFCDIEVIKEKFEDLKTTHGWFCDEYFIHEPSHVLSNDDVKKHGYRYHEHRTHCEQLFELMHTYIKQFDEVIQKFHELEKASSAKFGDGTDNA